MIENVLGPDHKPGDDERVWRIFINQVMMNWNQPFIDDSGTELLTGPEHKEALIKCHYKHPDTLFSYRDFGKAINEMIELKIIRTMCANGHLQMARRDENSQNDVYFVTVAGVKAYDLGKLDENEMLLIDHIRKYGKKIDEKVAETFDFVEPDEY